MTVIGVIIALMLLVVIVAAAVIASALERADVEARARQLDRRVHSAEHQIHEIGQRTREAIIAEAKRRQQHGGP
jgi:hypothetical protein